MPPSLYYDEETEQFKFEDVNSNIVKRREMKYEVKFRRKSRDSSIIDVLHQMINSESSGAIQIAWTVFMQELEEEVNDSKLKIQQLERRVKHKTKQLEDNEYAFEELQAQLSEETDMLVVQERVKFAGKVADLQSSLESKDKELQELMEFKKEIIEKFNVVFRQKKRSKIKMAELTKEHEDMMHELELQRDVISHLKKALNDSKIDSEREITHVYKRGIEKGRQLACYEEIEVLKQLEILKNIQLIFEREIKQHQKEIFEDD